MQFKKLYKERKWFVIFKNLVIVSVPKKNIGYSRYVALEFITYNVLRKTCIYLRLKNISIYIFIWNLSSQDQLLTDNLQFFNLLSDYLYRLRLRLPSLRVFHLVAKDGSRSNSWNKILFFFSLLSGMSENTNLFLMIYAFMRINMRNIRSCSTARPSRTLLQHAVLPSDSFCYIICFVKTESLSNLSYTDVSVHLKILWLW